MVTQTIILARLWSTFFCPFSKGGGQNRSVSEFVVSLGFRSVSGGF